MTISTRADLKSKKIRRSRFAPSPTGLIHCGNARTALFNLLMSMKEQGQLILRIENTDRARSNNMHVKNLLVDLKWLGIDWFDEPVYQAERHDVHIKYFKALKDKNLVYPCFCSDKELLMKRKRQLSSGKAPRYDGTCLQLTPDQLQSKINGGDTPAWRLHVEHGDSIVFDDIVKGSQSFNLDDIGDFVVRRADGTFPFLFANSIDDSEMSVTHVFRGEDHIANTPRQLIILDLLDLPRPEYGHLPLILGDAGAPLSKREKSFSVKDLRDQGYLPLAILNYLARVGCVYESNDFMSLDQLADNFRPDKISRSPAHFDINQLRYWQKITIAKQNKSEFIEWLGLDIISRVDKKSQLLFLNIMQQNILFPSEAEKWAEIFWGDKLSFSDDQIDIFKNTGKNFFKLLLETLDNVDNFLSVCKSTGKQSNLSGKKLYMPVRIMLTGRSDGPELAQIANLLGIDNLKKRISDVVGIF